VIKTIKIFPALLLFTGLSHHALADTDWSMDVKFSDGAVAKGVFVTNNAGTALESWNISVTGGLAVHDFVSASSNGVSTSDDFGQVTMIPNLISWLTGTDEALEFGDFGENAYSVFFLGDVLAHDPATIVGALDCGDGFNCGVFKSGSIVDPPLPAVPEPLSIILLGSVIVFASFVMRRRGKKRQA
jgi:hypothetical protein